MGRFPDYVGSVTNRNADLKCSQLHLETVSYSTSYLTMYSVEYDAAL